MVELVYNKDVACPISRKKVERVLREASNVEKKIQGVVEITVVSEAKIKKLNREYRGKNKVTDVLSFSMREGALAAGPIFGELYLCYTQIARQAKNFSVSTENEFIRMLAHGLLHLSGHDHQVPREASKMFKLQEKIVDRLKKK